MAHKTCRDCNQQLPMDRFGVDRRNCDGRKGVCAACENRRVRAWRAVNVGGKYAHHKAKAAKRAAAYFDVNKDRCLTTSAKWRSTNRQRKAATDRSWQQANRDRVNAAARARYAADPERRNVLARARAPRYAGAKAASVAKRRASQLRATPTWADPAAIRRLYEKARAIDRETGQRMHVDHIVPLVSPIVCGLHVENNLELLPAKVNQSKSNRQWPDMPSQ